MNRIRKTDALAADPKRLQKIRKAYLGDREVAEIAAEYGTTKQAIAMLAQLQGWRLRNGKIGKPPAMPAQPKADDRGDIATPRQLGLRLRRIIASEIADIEEKTDSKDDAEREKTVRRLASLTRSLDKLKLIKRPEQEKSADGKTKRSGKPADDAGLRAELERRLARLSAGSGEGGVSGQPDAAGDGMAS
ncbi:MAG TPA: hypothetical protein VGN05_01760 [Parvibaculum sp.]|jgi:hypothetical protein